MATVAQRQGKSSVADFRAAAERIRAEIVAQAWNGKIGAFASTYGGSDLDASLLQMASLRMYPAGDSRLIRTIDAIHTGLATGGWLMRYRMDDGFGAPQVAFILCTFWLIEALASTGRMAEARSLLDRARSALSPLGLLSEDYELEGLQMWGNFPQAYSHVGLIHAAFAASPRWAEVL
jgi:GH15 family glucan-1,4-alpha-glucosidase